jgi:hypothetical protein
MPSVSVAMSGLNSPRGLAWGPEGAPYVAEAGSAITSGVCVPAMEGPAAGSEDPRAAAAALTGAGHASP